VKLSTLLAAAVMLLVHPMQEAHAGQDRLYSLASVPPAQGGLVRGFRNLGGTYWVAIEGGGIYKSTDAGASWTASYAGIDSAIVRGIANDPSNIAIRYAVTLGNGGFYKSTDAGATWAASNAGLDCRYVNSATVVPSGVNVGHIYLATGCGGFSGVYKSTDQGASWVRVGVGTIPNNAGVFSVSTSPDGMFVRAGTTAGLYSSVDFGATWSLRNGTGGNVLSGPNGPVAPGVWFAGSRWIATVEGNGVFYSDDTGGNWTPATGLPAGAFNVGAVSNIGGVLWVSIDGAGLYKSVDSGASWALDTSMTGLPGKRVRFLLSEGTTWWAGTTAGIYKSTDSGANWAKASGGLPGGWVNTVAVHPSTGSTLYAASDTVYKSTDGGRTWAESDNGLGGLTFLSSFQNRIGAVLVDPSDPAVLYAATMNHGMYKSVDFGASWTPINNGLGANHGGHHIGRAGNFRISPSSPSTLYVARTDGSLYKTVDGGANWTDISIPAAFARAPAIAPDNADVVYVATTSGLQKTTDGGQSWISKSPGGFIAFATSRPQVHPELPDTVLLAAHVTDSRDVALGVSGVYLTTNGGDTWRQLVSNEKVTQAIFVKTPGSSRTHAYVSTWGQMGDGDAVLAKCTDILGDEFSVDGNCVAIDIPPALGRLRTMRASNARVFQIATTSGVLDHHFMPLGPDFNNDTRADILWRHTDGTAGVWHMDGAQLADDGNGGVAMLRSVPNDWIVAGMGDFDADGTSDILWRNTVTGDNYIYFMDGGAILASEGYIRQVPDQQWQVAGIGDFNGDRRSDILWRHAGTGENYIYFMRGLEVFDEGFIRQVAAPWSVAAVGDFDGDARADIWWRNTSTGENYLYPMQGLTIKATEGFTRQVTLDWQIKAIGDFNQDNRMDVLWRNPGTGENYIYPMDGTAILPSESYLPTVADPNWDIFGAGDYAGPNAVGDAAMPGRGISGILWHNTATGESYLWRLLAPMSVAGSPCGAMGCMQGQFLPYAPEVSWGIVNK